MTRVRLGIAISGCVAVLLGAITLHDLQYYNKPYTKAEAEAIGEKVLGSYIAEIGMKREQFGSLEIRISPPGTSIILPLNGHPGEYVSMYVGWEGLVDIWPKLPSRPLVQ